MRRWRDSLLTGLISLLRRPPNLEHERLELMVKPKIGLPNLPPAKPGFYVHVVLVETREHEPAKIHSREEFRLSDDLDDLDKIARYHEIRFQTRRLIDRMT